MILTLLTEENMVSKTLRDCISTEKSEILVMFRHAILEENSSGNDRNMVGRKGMGSVLC